MSNYVQFLTLAIILYCIFSPSLSLPRDRIQEQRPSRTCSRVRAQSGEISLTELANVYFLSMSMTLSRRIGRLFNQTHLEEVNAEARAQACPNWQTTKNALIRHLNSDKCNEEDFRILKGDGLFNREIVIFELLCNPSNTHSMLHLLRNTANNGIWECLVRPDVKEIAKGCVKQSLARTNRQTPSFQTVSSFFGCLNPAVAACAEGDILKERTMLRAWDEVGVAWDSAYRQFWENV